MSIYVCLFLVIQPKRQKTAILARKTIVFIIDMDKHNLLSRTNRDTLVYKHILAQFEFGNSTFGHAMQKRKKTDLQCLDVLAIHFLGLYSILTFDQLIDFFFTSACSGNSCLVTAEESSFSLDCLKIHDYMQVEFRCVDA